MTNNQDESWFNEPPTEPIKRPQPGTGGSVDSTDSTPNTDSVDAELREQYGKEIDVIIANAEQAAIDDKGMFADMDNNPMNRQTLAREILQLLTQARKEPSLPWITGLTCPACGSTGFIFVAEGGYLTCSVDTCPNPDYNDALAQARIGDEGEQKQREYREFCRGGRQFLLSALAHAGLAKELGTGADLGSVVRSMIAMFDDMGVPKSDPDRLYTQVDVDQKVVEALNAVLDAGPDDYVQGQRYLPLFKKGFNTSNDKWREAIAALLTTHHTPPQEPLLPKSVCCGATAWIGLQAPVSYECDKCHLECEIVNPPQEQK